MNAQIKKCTKSQAESIKRIQQQDMKNFQHVVKQKKKNQEENKSRQKRSLTKTELIFQHNHKYTTKNCHVNSENY